MLNFSLVITFVNVYSGFLTIHAGIDLVVCTTVDAFVNLCKGHKHYAVDGSDVAYKTAECWTL